MVGAQIYDPEVTPLRRSRTILMVIQLARAIGYRGNQCIPVNLILNRWLSEYNYRKKQSILVSCNGIQKAPIRYDSTETFSWMPRWLHVCLGF